MDVSGRIWVLELSNDMKTMIWQIRYVGENLKIDGWWIPGQSVIGWGGIFNVIPGPEEYILEAHIDHFSLNDQTLILNPSGQGFEWIYLREDTQILTSNGSQISLSEFETKSDTNVKVHCRPILRGCLASSIQILDE
ncbi:MAG: hypothetical protein A2Z14_17690 [Chloroflexi bacterium RBG_16_48_8]|nr:MAG: hypothetical protein A2Z14_17690 [Chloroflexi bacterium RBG_16_48_8]